jgi:hypothetical protein
VRAPAELFATKITDWCVAIDDLVYRFGSVVDLRRTTRFVEPRTAEGGFKSI